jgi:hypothetical protein
MSWLGKVFSTGVKEAASGIAEIADRFIETPDEKARFALEVEARLQQRDAEIEQTLRAELGAKERVLVAELSQGDNFTKRARPSVVYAGLAFIGINYVLTPMINRLFGIELPPIPLPPEFWATWGGICATWVIGRSAEKRGSRHPAVQAITGSPPPGGPAYRPSMAITGSRPISRLLD